MSGGPTWIDALPLAGLACSVLASRFHTSNGRDISSVSADNAFPYTPRGVAFSIWAPIYLLLLAVAVLALRVRLAPTYLSLLFCAQMLTAAWVPLFVSNTGASLVGAALVLVASAAAAVLATHVAGPLTASDGAPRAVLPPVAAALFAGWLLCAGTLSIGIAVRRSYPLAFAHPAAGAALLLALSATAAALATTSRNAVLAAPCVWALALQPNGVGATEAAGIMLCALGALGSLRSPTA